MYTLLLAVIGGLLARMYERELRSFAYRATTFRGYQLAAADSARLKPGDAFQECAKTFSDDRQDGKQISKYTPRIAQGGKPPQRIAAIDPVMHQEAFDEGAHLVLRVPFPSQRGTVALYRR